MYIIYIYIYYVHYIYIYYTYVDIYIYIYYTYVYIYTHVSLYICMIYTHMFTLLYLHVTSKIPDDLPLFFLLRYFLFLYFQLGTHAYLFVDEAEGEARLIGWSGMTGILPFGRLR